MSAEANKPLHVRVAEALGFGGASPCPQCPMFDKHEQTWHFDHLQSDTRHPVYAWLWESVYDFGDACTCWCRSDKPHVVTYALQRFDTNWSATGPLMERYGLTVYHEAAGWAAREDGGRPGTGLGVDHAGSPLEAVCHLLISLGKAGRLAPRPECAPTETP